MFITEKMQDPVFPANGLTAYDVLTEELGNAIKMWCVPLSEDVQVEQASRWLTRASADAIKASWIRPSIKDAHQTFERGLSLMREYSDLRLQHSDEIISLPKVPRDFLDALVLKEENLRIERNAKKGGQNPNFRRKDFIGRLLALFNAATGKSPSTTIVKNDRQRNDEDQAYFGTDAIEFVRSVFEAISKSLPQFLPRDLVERAETKKSWDIPTAAAVSKLVQQAKRDTVPDWWPDIEFRGRAIFEQEAAAIVHEIREMQLR